MSHTTDPPECEAPPSHSRTVPVTCAVALLLVMLDNTALTVVLPSIVSERGVSEATGRWLFVTFMLANLAVLPAASGLAARIGRRGAFQSGLACFALGSTLMALDGPLWLMIAGRLLQGSGGALMLPNAGGLLEANLPREQRGRGVSTWVTVGSVGIFVGPLAGGVLADAASWRLVFVVEVVVAVIGLWMSRRLRDVIPHGRRSIDLPGMILGGAGVSLGCLAVLEAGRPDPMWALVLLGVVAAPAFVVTFVRHERRVELPALDLGVLSTAGFGSLIAACLVYNAGVAGVAYVLSLSLQRDQGLTASAAGWVVFATMALLPLGSQLAGRVRARRGIGRRLAAASAGLATAFAASALGMLVALPAALVALAGIGAAMGLLFASDTVATMELVRSEHLPSALANLSLSRQVGSVIGVAVLGTIHQQVGQLAEPGSSALASTLAMASVAMIPAVWLLRRRVAAALPGGGATAA